MKFAYADPPYIGMSHFYKNHPDYAGEVDHQELIARLMMDYPDGWVLHCSSTTLRQILSYCPDGVRVMAWVKPFASFKPGVNPGYCWEPVVVLGGRKRTRKQPTVRDWFACNITLRKGLVGAKPPEVVKWLYEVLNVQPEDTVDDLFPGTGIVGRTIADLQRQPQKLLECK